ncbi:MAG TPA: ABC transporter substrate-binding protein [Candidatus Cybelea sp.]|nr:ABC transporter substrate-binding protein [Candidatus Cybelea sp.]
MRAGFVTRLILGSAALGVGAAGGAWADDMKVRGVTKTEIVLGSHTDLSGVAASFGVPVTNAVRLRIDEVNAAGGIHGRKIKLVVEDTGYQVPKAVQAVNKLINRDNIFAMVAGLGTPMNNAVFDEQLKANVPNMFPITAARQMFLPFNHLKFALAATYYDQMRAGVKWMVEQKGKKNICAMYQDTDFGAEVFAGIKDEVAALNMKLAEVTTHKPTDTDFTAQITKLRDAKCDLIGMGTIVRDAIIPYSSARKIGWTNVDFLGASSSYDQTVAGAQGGVTDGFYAMGLDPIPYRESSKPEVLAWMDKYKAKYGSDPNIGAVYGWVLMDVVVIALDRAGNNLNTETFIKGLESIDGYHDIFGAGNVSFSATKHQGANSSFVAEVKGGKWISLTDPIGY